MRNVIPILLTVVVCGIAAAQPRLIKLDFGPAKSPVMDGFQAVTPDTRYSAETGFGWQPYAVRDHKDPAVNNKLPDPLWRDFIMMSGSKTRLRIDVPDGEYHLWFWCGRWDGDCWSLPPIQGFGLQAEDGGEVVHRTDMEQFLNENFHVQLTRWLTPRSDFYTDWIASSFRRFDGTVTAKGGRLLLAPYRRFALNGLVLCPEADRADAQRDLDELSKTQRDALDCRNVTPLPPADFTPTKLEEQTGVVVFAPQHETLVYPTSAASPATPRCKALLGAACAGETEPLTIAVRPLKNIDRVRARMTELTGPINIGGPDVRAYTVQMLPRGTSGLAYRYEGHLLRAADRHTLYANQTKQYWWDVTVPPKAPPGAYLGYVVLEIDQGSKAQTIELARIPVRLEVLAMDLLGPNETGVKQMTPYARFFGYHWRQEWDLYRPLYWEDLRLMKRCGLNTAMLGADARAFGSIYAKQGELPMSALDRTFQRWQICKELGFEQVFWYGFQGLTSIGWRSADSNRFAKQLGDAYLGPKHREGLRHIVGTLERMRKQRELPTLIVSIMDEAICHGGTEALPAYTKMVQFFADLKKEFGIRYAVLDSSYEVDGYVKGLDIVAPNRKGWAANFAKMDAVGAERWLYNTGLRRFQMGYYCWRAKLKGMWVWFFNDSRHCQLYPYNTRTSALAYQTAHGPIPTVHAPWVREGIDDLRYLRTLESYIERGLASKNAAAIEAAKAGQAFLKDLHDRMTDDFTHYVANGPSGHPHPGAWDPSALDAIRSKVAGHCVAIAKALGKKR